MSDLFRGEFVLRRCRGDNGRDVDVHIGWMSAPAGTFTATHDADQIATAVRFDNAPSQIMMLPTADMATAEILPDADLASSLTSMRFPGSEADDDFVSGGALILRATRQFGRRGNPVYLAALVMQACGPDADPAQIYELRGDTTSFDILPSHRSMPQNPNGMALTQIHRSPIWSINGDEPSGPVSTMRLDILDECQRFEDVLARGVQEDDPEYLRFNRSPAKMIVDNVSNNPDYAEFRKEMIAAGFANRWASFETEGMSEARSRKADEIVRSIMTRKAA